MAIQFNSGGGGGFDYGNSVIGGYSLDFFYNGDTSDKFYKYISNHTEETDQQPAIAPATARLVVITFTLENIVTVGFTIQVRLNGAGVPSYTTPNLVGQYGTIVVTPNMPINFGDRLALYTPNVPTGTKPKKPAVSLYFA